MTFFQSENKILLSSITLLVILLLLNMYFSHIFTMGAFYNSDALYVPNVVSDIIDSHKSIFSWNYSRAPSFFDIFIFLLINIFFSSYISIAIFFILQILITVIIIYKIYRISFNSELSVIVTSISIIGLCYILLNQIHPYLIILKSAHHYSEYIIWLVSSYYLFSFLKNPLGKSLYLPMTLFFLECISDQLYYIHFVIPALVFSSVYLVMRKPEYKNKIITTLILMLILSLIAVYISSLIFASETKIKIDINFNSIANDFRQLFSYMLYLNNKSIIILFVNVTFYGMCIIRIIMKEKHYEWIIFYLLSFLISVFLLAISPSSNILGRYLLPYIFTPFLLFFLVIPLSYSLYTKYLLWFILIFSSIYNVFTSKFKDWNYSYYPEHVSCVDAELRKRGINSIIGDYWVARHYSFLSRADIIVTPFKMDYSRNTIVSKRGKFQNHYSGVLVNSVDGRGFKQDDVIKQFGASNEIIKCPKVTLLIYNKDSLIINSRNILIHHD